MISSIVRFRPTGPWRFGPDSGVRDRVDLIYHSDSLYSAVTGAMLRLGVIEEWLDATARKQDGAPEVRFSSMFPFQRDVLLVPPPRSLWPPPPTTKVRFKSAKFVPIAVVQGLVAEQPVDENRWIIDGECQCMIASGEGPFRIGLRGGAAIDRLNAAAVDPHVTACIEFGRDAGLWTMVVFASEEARHNWQRRVRSALRLLADSGFGGERSRGWGRSDDPQWRDAPAWWAAPETDKAHWLLSVYTPAETDAVDWKAGNYATVTRTGRIESSANWGELKTPGVMLAEGSVLLAPDAPRGLASDVAPSGFPHAVYRAGFAVTIPIPWKAPGSVAPAAPKPKLRETVVAAPQSEPPAPAPEAEPAPEAAPQTESPALAHEAELTPEPEPDAATHAESPALAHEAELTPEPEPAPHAESPAVAHEAELTPEPEPAPRAESPALAPEAELTPEPAPAPHAESPALAHEAELTPEPEPAPRAESPALAHEAELTPEPAHDAATHAESSAPAHEAELTPEPEPAPHAESPAVAHEAELTPEPEPDAATHAESSAPAHEAELTPEPEPAPHAESPAPARDAELTREPAPHVEAHEAELAAPAESPAPAHEPATRPVAEPASEPRRPENEPSESKPHHEEPTDPKGGDQ